MQSKQRQSQQCKQTHIQAKQTRQARTHSKQATQSKQASSSSCARQSTPKHTMYKKRRAKESTQHTTTRTHEGERLRDTIWTIHTNITQHPSTHFMRGTQPMRLYILAIKNNRPTHTDATGPRKHRIDDNNAGSQATTTATPSLAQQNNP